MSKNKILKYVFLLLSIGLTAISLSAGFYVYDSLFGAYTALLIATVFEILRLSSLFSIPYLTNRLYKTLSATLYIIVAGLCLFSAIVSFNSRIIDIHQKNIQIEKQQIYDDLYKIKHKYQETISEKIKELEQQRNITEKKYTSWQSNVYKRRLDLFDQKIVSIETERDRYFNELNSKYNDREWIENQKAILGINSNYAELKLESIPSAIVELTGMKSITAQKIFGILLSVVVEFGIVMLAIIGFGLDEVPVIKKRGRKPKKKENKVIAFIKKLKKEPIKGTKKEPKEKKKDVKAKKKTSKVVKKKIKNKDSPDKNVQVAIPKKGIRANLNRGDVSVKQLDTDEII